MSEDETRSRRAAIELCMKLEEEFGQRLEAINMSFLDVHQRLAVIEAFLSQLRGDEYIVDGDDD
jgi:hypothetical protein